MKALVIVESPTKAKTIAKFLDKNFTIKSSFGHVRDLPKSEMGVDIENNFHPRYVIPTDKRKKVTELKKAAAKADVIYFATDADREGEAISWHLAEILETPADQLKRITFHEITKSAILDAIREPRKIDLHLVDAQQARRVLDRLVGYELSPFLWHKVAKGLSAGRVQSVAVRLVVEREREIQKFVAEEYWTIEALFEKSGAAPDFSGVLHAIDGKKLDKLEIKNGETANKILRDLASAAYNVSRVEKKRVKRAPAPPFTTSSLQQESNNKLGYSAKQTMMLAQQLYEQGYITYMRTDSVNMAEKFLSDAQEFIGSEFGKKYQLGHARVYQTKSKMAQEAHEAIRPTEVSRTPDELRAELDPRQHKLYDLIWRRALATQMPEAEFDATSVDIINGTNGQPRAAAYTFRATGSTIFFDGYLKIYPEGQKENVLPDLLEGDAVEAKTITPKQHFTEPSARYSDATLVKILEEHGIGRPSTYAPTIATIEDRGYVLRDEKKRLAPTDIAFVVNDLLVEHFPQIVDYEFTAKMEETFDDVAEGKKEWEPVIRDFYGPFKENLTKKESELTKKEITETATSEVCEKCGQPMVVKIGRFGKFLACTGYPECKNTKNLGKNGEVEETPPPEVTDKKCPTCGAPLVVKVGRFGPFLSCSRYPECKTIVNIEKKTGVACPKCGQGEIIEKRSKRGKTFYSCNRYPECDFALWSKPTGEKCPNCASLLVFGAKGMIKCGQCDYSKTS